MKAIIIDGEDYGGDYMSLSVLKDEIRLGNYEYMTSLTTNLLEICEFLKKNVEGSVLRYTDHDEREELYITILKNNKGIDFKFIYVEDIKAIIVEKTTIPEILEFAKELS